MYSCLVRNGYLMPPRKDAMLTQKFLKGVQSKKFWILHSDHVLAVKQCADPPSRKVLAKIVSSIMKTYPGLEEPMLSGMRRTAKHIKKRPPSPQWLLLVLATLDQDHDLFHKGYVAPKKPKAFEEVLIANPDNFFDGLPVVENKKKRFMSLYDKKTKKGMQVAKMQKSLAKMQEKLAQQQAALDQVDSDAGSSSSDDSDGDSQDGAGDNS